MIIPSHDTPGRPQAPARATPRFVWDDELWDQVWERTLDQVERHTIAMAVWRRRLDEDDAFQVRIGTELARRWRRTSRNYAIMYGLWTLFWGVLAVDDLVDHGRFLTLLSPVCAALGVAAVAICLVLRRRVGGLAAATERVPVGAGRP